MAIEAVFAAALLGRVVWGDRRRQLRRARSTWAIWALIFVGGIGATFPAAPELAAMDPHAGLPAVGAAGLFAFYVFQIGLLTFAEHRPTHRDDAASTATPATRPG